MREYREKYGIEEGSQDEPQNTGLQVKTTEERQRDRENREEGDHD